MSFEEVLEGKIGYTTDGFVFFITDVVDSHRQHMQATFTWDAKTAMKIAQDILNTDIIEGLLVFTSEALDRCGQSIPIKFTWNPKTGIEIAQDIANAANEAAKFYKGKKK